MNIVFFGSSKFAVPALEAIIKSGSKVLCVVTQPDRQKGRGMHFEGTAVKHTANQYKLKLYQPQKINNVTAFNLLKELKPDLFVVVSYGQILSKEILSLPKIFSINAHGSLLPKYRGAAPINRAIINGEQVTGVTIIKMNEKMDAGKIIMQSQILIKDEDNAIELEGKLSLLAAELLVDSVKHISRNDYKLKPQLGEVSFAPKLIKQDGLINWEVSAQHIYNLIRGCISWPGAFTHCKGKLLKIYKASLSYEEYSGVKPGEIIKVLKDGIVVAAEDRALIIRELQIEGKRRMKAEEFISGHKISPGEIFDK